MEYTGKPGPADLAPPADSERRAVPDPGALASSRDHASAEHMLAVLAAAGVAVDVALSAARPTSLEGECTIALGLWGVAVHGCAKVGEAAAVQAALYEQTWRYLELGDAGGALKNVAHVVARVKQRTTPSFDPQLAPVLPPSPNERSTAVVFFVVLLGVGLAGLLLQRGAAGGLRLPFGARRGGAALRAGAVGLVVTAAFAAGCGHDALGPATLTDAAREGDIDALTRLLAAGARVAAADADGNTALHAAVRAGRADAVAVLLHAGAPLAAVAGPRHRTALHEAALQGTPETLLALLAAGADPAARDTFGETPLHLLVRADAVRAVAAASLLLGAGADPAAVDARGFTVAHAAAAADAPTLLRGSLERAPQLAAARAPSGETPLDVALRYGSDRAAEILFQQGARPTRADAVPPLHEAARCDSVARVAALVAAGADLDRRVDGKTALDVARAHGSLRAAALLLPSAATRRR